MIAFDSDIWTEIGNGDPACLERAKSIPREDQCVPIVVAEESLRGWLDCIRKVESGKVKATLSVAYAALDKALHQLGQSKTLPYAPLAHEHYLRLKSLKIRIGTRDLRIASIALARDATLISRNRRDYELVPSLKLEV